MPSFDVVSEVDQHELTNAVDQANRELETRYDFRGVDASFALKETEITIAAEVEFQLTQLSEMLDSKLIKRGIDIVCLERKEPYGSGKQMKQDIDVRQGLDKDQTKKITKLIKENKLKVQAQIQGEKVRVTGKKRDELQAVMALLREAELGMPLQFNNFRD